MSATTVFGTAHRAGGLSRTTSASGRFQDALLIREIEPGLPEAGIVVTLDHDSDAPVGEVVYCELDRYGRLNVVSVLDGDWTGAEQPLHYSGEFKYRDEQATASRARIAERACLVGISITAHPASLEAPALGVIAGDIRRTLDRSAWPLSFGWQAPLLDRAVANLPPRGETRARRLFCPDDAGRRADLDHRSSLHPAEIEAGQWEPQRPPGRLQHSAPYRGVIAVR